MLIDSVVMKKMAKTAPYSEGSYPLFGFAVEDYKAECGLTDEDIKDKYVFGAVLCTGHVDEELFAFCRMLMGEPEVLLLVFDYNDTTKEEIELLKEHIEGINGFKELENVYEDRIVFASFN